jgi:hypothetical protein
MHSSLETTTPLLKPVYGLAILASSFSEGTKWYHHYRMTNTNDLDSTIEEGIELIFVELPKYQVKTAEERLLRRLWIQFLQMRGGYQDPPEGLIQSQDVSEALKLLEESEYTPRELLEYERYWDAIRLDTGYKETYFEKGKDEGIVIGIEKGK